MTDTEGEIHDLAPEAFHEHVHSFEHWLQSVRSYLDERPYGHREDLEEEVLPPEQRERVVAVLCSYALGETAALEGAGGLIRQAPNRPAKIFLATQAVDEARHLEVIFHRMHELGVPDPEAELVARAHPALARFKERLLQLVAGGDWQCALFAQNVVLEAMEFAAFLHHAKQADAITRDLLLGIIRDERRHIGFGESEIGRCLHRDAALRPRLEALRRELDPLVLECFQETLRAVAAPTGEDLELGRDYLAAVGRLAIG